MKYLKLFLKENKGKTALSLLLLLGQVIGTLLIPYLIADLIESGILRGNMDAVWQIGGKMLLVSLVATAVSVWGSYATADLGARFGKDMREKLFRHTQDLSLRQFDDIGVSSMITRTTSDIANLQQTMGMVLQMAVPAPIIVGTAIVMTASTSVEMAFLLIGFMVIFMLFAVYMLKKSGKLSHSIQARLDRINKVVRESITGVRVIRAFGKEDHEEKRSGKAYEDYAQNMIRLNKLFAVLNPAVWLIMGLMMAAILALGGVYALEGTIGVGEITAVSEYAIITLSYMIMGAGTLTTLPKARSCLERLEEVLDTSPSVIDQPIPGESAPTKAAIEFERVTFAYPGAEEPVIKKLSFTCMPGQTTAIIGSTGSGKSTVADLLLRLHDIQSGQIRIQGTDITSLTQIELRSRIGYVPQKAFLFSGTIADNLRMGNPSATEEDLYKALEIAQSISFVDQLPQKLETPIAQGGTNFSGGQRQRLSIARALTRKASIFIFDDSFSALDAKTDALLRAALRDQVIEPAKLIIAQRVSTILDADQILVLEEGRLAGAGTHQELMDSCSVYQAIVESQMNREEAMSL